MISDMFFHPKNSGSNHRKTKTALIDCRQTLSFVKDRQLLIVRFMQCLHKI